MVDDRSFRASDDDRERLVAVLREQMVAGRLTSAELDERAGAAYTAKTWDDLRGLVRDLPVTVQFADERNPVRQRPAVRPSPRTRGPSALLPVALTLLAIIIISDRIFFFAPLIVFGAIVICARQCSRRL